MTIYICKCGRRVSKNTSADTTGNRDTENCKGCPYLLPWGPFEFVESQGFVRNVRGYECRMSKDIEYATRFCGSIDDKCSCYIASLDFDFLTRVSNWIKETYPGGELNGSFFTDDIRAVEYVSNGRYRMSIGCAQNKKGIAAKAALLHRFFDESGARLDKTPEEEKAIVLAAIEAGKAKARERKENMDYIISKHEATGRLYAYYKGSFWFWDSHVQRWLLSQFAEDLYQEYRKSSRDFAREDLLAQTDDFYLLDDYEVSPNCIKTLLQCNPKTAERENPTNAAEDAQQCAPTASDALLSQSQSVNADAQQDGGDDSANPTPAAPVSPADAGAATQSQSAAEPVSLEADECTENPTYSAVATAAAEGTAATPEPLDSASMTAVPAAKNSEPAGVASENVLAGADGSTAFDYSGLDDQTVADDVCPYLELIENSKKYSCQCSICGDRFVNTEICNKTFLSCGWYLDQQDKDALNHSEENTDKDNCLCRTCGSEECPGRGCNKECPNGSEGSCFTATCPGYIERTDIICKDKVTNAPSAAAAVTSDESAARMCEGPDEETQTTPAAASGAALESLHAQAVLPQNAPAQDIAADAPSALGFDFGADESTNAELLQCAQTFVIGKVAQVMAAKRAHDLTANNKNGAFGKWCAAVGISRDKGNQLVNIADNFGNIELEGKPIIEVTPISLLALGAKPSTPDVLTEGIGRGEITTIKQFRELEAQLKAVQTERDEAWKAKEKAEQERDAARDAQANLSAMANKFSKQRDAAEQRVEDAERRAEEAHKAANTYHCQYEEANAQKNALLDKQGAYIYQVAAAEQRAEEAERRARAAEEDAAGWKQAGLEMQELVDQRDERIRELESGITVEAAAVDQEEIERRANELSEPLVKIINQKDEQIERMASGNTVAVQASVLEQYIKSMKASLLGNASRAELACYDVGALDSLAEALREFADEIDGLFEEGEENEE